MLSRPTGGRLTGLGVVAGLAAALVLIARAPDDIGALGPLPRPAPLPALETGLPAPLEQSIRLHLTTPPHLPWRTLARDAPLEVAVSLPPGLRPEGLRVDGVPLEPHPHGGLLRLPPGGLAWGLNLVHLEGADRFGQPVDRVWPLLVGDLRAAGAWVEPAVTVRLLREGFIDADDLDDDLSSIARRQVEAALALLPPVEAGPLTASHFRASQTDVTIVPGPGQLAVSVDFRRVYMDVETGPVRIENLVIRHMWVDAVLRVEADALGRPRVTLDDISPHIDLVERTEGAWNWIVDRAAWFLEIAGELLAEGPLREAVTSALDDALSQWVSTLFVATVPPLAERRLEVSYRFARIAVDDEGLTADLDLRVACEDGAAGSLGRLAWAEDAGGAGEDAVAAADGATGAPLHVALTADGVNAVLHALWRCGALATEVGFEEAHAELPLFVPATVGTTFALPPVLQPVGDGQLGVGVGGLLGRVDYGDAEFEVAASGHVPITLEPTVDGRGLRIGFDPASAELTFFTDCVTRDGAPCRDNALFDRLAWLALPFLPPVGATLPIPDVRLPSSSLIVRLGAVRFDPVGGRLHVAVSYELGGR